MGSRPHGMNLRFAANRLGPVGSSAPSNNVTKSLWTSVTSSWKYCLKNTEKKKTKQFPILTIKIVMIHVLKKKKKNYRESMESPKQSIWRTIDAQQMTQLMIMTANTNIGSARYQFSALGIVTHSCVMISPCEGTTTIMPGLQKRNRRKIITCSKSHSQSVAELGSKFRQP